MKNLFFTILVIPERQGASFRLRLHKRLLYWLALVGLLLFSTLSALVIHYVYILDREFEARALRHENLSLKAQLKLVNAKVSTVEEKLSTLARLDTKLRSLTVLADRKSLATGPMSNEAPDSLLAEQIDALAPPLSADVELGFLRDSILNSRLHGLAEEAERQTASLSDLVDYFSAQKTMLASTPSIWPTMGWISSNFGPRIDPYTGNQTMHVGIDIATREGAKVIAPAAGRVVFVGERGPYGNLLAIDHGRGLVSQYGHLQKSLVKIGDEVKRGEQIALAGNTGRSTGPHVHYEVRQDGIAINPRRFIID